MCLLSAECTRSRHQQQGERRADRSKDRRPSKPVRKVHKSAPSSDLNAKPGIILFYVGWPTPPPDLSFFGDCRTTKHVEQSGRILSRIRRHVPKPRDNVEPSMSSEVVFYVGFSPITCCKVGCVFCHFLRFFFLCTHCTDAVTDDSL